MFQSITKINNYKLIFFISIIILSNKSNNFIARHSSEIDIIQDQKDKKIIKKEDIKNAITTVTKKKNLKIDPKKEEEFINEYQIKIQNAIKEIEEEKNSTWIDEYIEEYFSLDMKNYLKEKSVREKLQLIAEANYLEEIYDTNETKPILVMKAQIDILKHAILHNEQDKHIYITTDQKSLKMYDMATPTVEIDLQNKWNDSSYDYIRQVLEGILQVSVMPTYQNEIKKQYPDFAISKKGGNNITFKQWIEVLEKIIINSDFDKEEIKKGVDIFDKVVPAGAIQGPSGPVKALSEEERKKLIIEELIREMQSNPILLQNLYDRMHNLANSLSNQNIKKMNSILNNFPGNIGNKASQMGKLYLFNFIKERLDKIIEDEYQKLIKNETDEKKINFFTQLKDACLSTTGIIVELLIAGFLAGVAFIIKKKPNKPISSHKKQKKSKLPSQKPKKAFIKSK